MTEQNIALIAVGRIGKMYGKLIEKMPGLRLKMVIDKYETKQSLAEQEITAENVTASPEALYNDPTIKQVIVAASTPSHAKLCSNLIDAGKHILCEKPLSFDHQVIRQIGEKARKQSIILQVGYVRRFDPNYREIKKRINNNEAGDIHLIKIVNRDPQRPSIEFVKKSGGIFMDFLVHDFDMLHYLTGSKITKVYAEADVKVDERLASYDDYDTTLVTVKLANGVLATIDCTRETGYGYDQRLEVFGNQGCLRVENLPRHQITTYASNGVSSALPRWDFKERYREAFQVQLESFLESVRSNSEPLVSCNDAAQNVQTASACILSKKEDRPVYIDCDESI